MKEVLIMALLSFLIVLSGGFAQDAQSRQINFNLGGDQIGPMNDQSSFANTAEQSGSWSEKPIAGQMNVNPIQDQSGDQSAVLSYSQYFQSTSNAPSNPITAPTEFNLQEQEPSMLYFGSSQRAIPYSQYQTYALSAGLNSFWIKGSSSWTQYAMVPLGSSLSLIGTSSTGGYGYLYDVRPDGTLETNSYYFYPYNQIGFYADQEGQHLLFFNINGLPSNIIVIDVEQYQPRPIPPAYALVTVSSSWLRGYDVSVDGSHQATEGMTGEPDGVVTIQVPGNQYHTIAVEGNLFSFSDYKYFSAGMAYTLNV